MNKESKRKWQKERGTQVIQRKTKRKERIQGNDARRRARRRKGIKKKGPWYKLSWGTKDIEAKCLQKGRNGERGLWNIIWAKTGQQAYSIISWVHCVIGRIRPNPQERTSVEMLSSSWKATVPYGVCTMTAHRTGRVQDRHSKDHIPSNCQLFHLCFISGK